MSGTAPVLGRVGFEPVTPLRLVTTGQDSLGEPVSSWEPDGELSARVTPVSAEQAVQAGLTGARTRLRLRFYPSRLIAPGDRFRLRDHDWEAVTAEVRSSYAVAVVEQVT